MANDKGKKLYETLKEDPRYKNIGKDYESFKTFFSDPENGKKLYSSLKTNPKYTGLGDDYESFSTGFGFVKKKDLSQQDSKSTSQKSGIQSQISQNTNGENDLIPSVGTTVPTPLTDKGADEYLEEQLSPEFNTEFTKTIGRDNLTNKKPDSKIVKPIQEAFLPNAPKDLRVGDFDPNLQGIGAPILPANPEIENSQGIGGKEILDSKQEEQQGNVAGYMYNQLLDGVGSLASGAGDAGLQSNKMISRNPFMVAIDRVISGEAIPEMPESFKPTDLISYVGKNIFGIGGNLEQQNDKQIADYRENVAPSVRNFLTETIGATVDEKTKAEYDNNIITGSIGGLVNSAPSIVATAVTGSPSAFFIQSYDGALKSLEGKDVDDETKTVYATGIGYISSKLEKIGFDRIFPGAANGLAKAIFNKSLKEATAKTGRKVTGNVLDKYIEENLKGFTKRFSKFGSKTAQAFVAEYGTGAAQEAANVGGEYLLNAGTGKSVFDTSDMTKWEGFIDNVARINKAGVMEGIGGGIMGAASSIFSSERKKKVSSATKQLQLINDQLKNEDTPPKAKELLLQRKLNIEQEVEQEMANEQEEQKKLPEAKISQMKLLAEKIDELDNVLQDPEVSVEIKESLQEEFDSTVAELESIKNESAEVVQPLSKPTQNEEITPSQEQTTTTLQAPAITQTELTQPEGESVSEIVDEVDTDSLLVEQAKTDIGGKTPTDVSNPALRDVESTAKALDGKDLSNISSEKRIMTQKSKGDFVLDGNNPKTKSGKSLPALPKIKKRGNDKEMDLWLINAAKIESENNPYLLTLIEAEENSLTKNGLPTASKESLSEMAFGNPYTQISYNPETPSSISEAYHKAKADGSNPELVKAVEQLLLNENPTEIIPESTNATTETDTTAGTGSEINNQQESTQEIDYGFQDINQTDDTAELAKILQDEADTNTDMNEVENAIRQYGLKVDRDSYTSFGDKNNITKTMAKTYFKKGAGGLDTAAMEINNQFFNGEEIVTPQDLVNYMESYQDGGRGYSSRANAARAKLFDKTGKSYNKKTAKKLIDAKKKLQEQEEISSLIQDNELTLDNIDDFIPVLDFLYNTKEESTEAYNKIKKYLTDNQNANTGTNSESNSNDREGSQPDNTSGREGRADEDGNTGEPTASDAGGQGYEERLTEAEKLVKEKEDAVKVLQNEYDKASKSLSKNLTENQTGMFENKTQSMFDDKSSQEKIVKDKKAKLDNAKKELADAKTNLEAVKDSKNQTEFDWDAFLDQSDVAPITDFLDGLKINQGNAPFSKVLPVVELYNAAIELIKVAVKTGNTLRKAVNLAVDYLRESGATEAQIKGFKEDIKGKITTDKEAQETIKQTIKNSTESKSKSKVVIDELKAIKNQMKDFERGFKEANEKAKKEQKEALKDQDNQTREKFEEYDRFQKEQQEAYEKEGQKVREKLLDVLKNIKDLKLFNGMQMSQNGMVNMIRTVLNAGSDPKKLSSAVDYIIKRLEIMDYDNKISSAKNDINYLRRQYFPRNQKTVSRFLSIDPEQVPASDFVDYLNVILDLKNHAKNLNGFQISDFGYVEDMTKRLSTPSNNIVQPKPQTSLRHNVSFTKPTETIKEKILNGLKKFKDNWLSYKRGMPDKLYKLKEKMLGRISVENYKAMVEARKLNDLISKNPNVKIEDVDAALRGDMDALNSLPEEIATSVNLMRAHIDRLSQFLIDEGLVKDSQKATIEVNLGQYLNRSYEIFDNKDWTLDNLPEPLYNKAAQLLYDRYYPEYRENNPNMSHQELDEAVKNRVEAKIKEYFNKDENRFFNQKNDGSKDLSVMMQRSDIPMELRELFGERKDPVYNYLTTIQKIAAFAETSKFLKDVRDQSLGTLMWDKNDPNRPADAIATIVSEGSETMAPLNGLYMTKELADAFKQQDELVPTWLRYYLKGIGAVKAGKTIGSIVTHFKNVEGNFGFILANGHWPNGDFAKAWNAVWDDFKGIDSKNIREIILPLIENGVIKQNVGVNEIKAMFDPNSSSDETFKRLFGKNKTLGEKIKSFGVKSWGKISDTYQSEDDFFKIFGYMSDLKRYSKALYGKEVSDLTDTERKELNEYVSEMVKNTYPTFSRVPRAARIGSMYLPFFGNFVSFQAESYRVGYNIFKQAFNELKSENPELRKIGASRLVGITTYNAIKNSLLIGLGKAGLGGLMGMLADDDEEEQRMQDVKRYVAPFSKQSDVIALPTTDGNFSYIDMSSYDPFGSQAKIMNAAFSSERPEQGVVNAIIQFTSPFVDREITAGMLLDLASNQDIYGRKIYNEEDDFWPKSMDIAKHIGKTIEPGTSSWARRLITSGDSTGEIKALAYRTYKVNIPQQFTFKMRDYRDRLKNVEDIYKKEYYSKDSSPESRLETYNRANEKTRDLVLEMHKDYMAALRLGAGEDKLVTELRDVKISKKLRAAITTGNPNYVNIKDREGIIPKSRQE